jgi:uncharacterized protein
VSKNKFPVGSANFTLPGEAGDIQIRTFSAKPQTLKTIVICHPHPLHGGTMDNKVVTTMVRSFHQLDFNVVCFNFRGVGLSQGEHAQGIGETADLLTVVDWLFEVLPEAELYLAGFSFGSYVAYRAATISRHKDRIVKLLLIAPPATYPEFSELPEPEMPWVVVQGEADEIIDPDKVFAWLESRTSKPIVIRMPETSHFFHRKLVDLKNHLLEVFSC